MKPWYKQPATYLEAGIGAVGLAILGAMAFGLFHRAIEVIDEALRNRQAPPGRGTVSPERHQHVSTMSAR
jgi:hypothetical protein